MASPTYPSHWRAYERYPPIPESKLTKEQKHFWDYMTNRINKEKFGNAFKLKGPNGEFWGPPSFMMYTPMYSEHVMELNRQVLLQPSLEPAIKEVIIFATVSHWCASFSGYLIYSHSRNILNNKALSVKKAEQIGMGFKPDDLTPKESAAYDLAMRLVRGGAPLEQELWERCNEILGKDQTAAAIQLTAYYSLHSITLNAGIVGVPPGETLFGKPMAKL